MIAMYSSKTRSDSDSSSEEGRDPGEMLDSVVLPSVSPFSCCPSARKESKEKIQKWGGRGQNLQYKVREVSEMTSR